MHYEELRAACEQTLEEQKQSMANLLDRIALLCDDHGTSTSATPMSLACAARRLAVQRVRIEDCDTGGDIRKEAVEAVGILGPTFASSNLPLRLIKQPKGGNVSGVLPSLPVSPLEGERFPPESPDTETENDSSLRADEEKLEEAIAQEFTVPLLPFIDAAGEIQRPVCAFSAAFDRFKHQGCFSAACLQAQAGRLADLVDSQWFKILSAVMIMVNYYFIVYQTDYKMSHLRQEEPLYMFYMEVSFTAFYVWELCCQVLAHRKEFFLGPEMVWNLFDFVIVFVSVFELIVTMTGGKGVNLSFLRVLRFLKLSRVLRMFSALRSVKEIRIMVDALAGSFLIFVFCSIMLAMFYSIFAIFFVQGMTTYLEDTVDVDHKLLQDINTDFSTVSSTMLALFMSVTGGNDWSQYHGTVAAVGVTYNYLWLFFIGFSFIAFLNVITGVFAEKAMSLATPTVDEIMVRRTAKEMKDAKELVDLLHRVIGRVSGYDAPCTLNSKSFEHFLSHSEVVNYLEARGLKPSSARRFFTLLLEIHGTDTVDFGTFTSACVKLDGNASSIDLHVLSAELKSMQLKQSHLTHFLKENLTKISSCVEGRPAKMRPSMQSFAPVSSEELDVKKVQMLMNFDGDHVPVEEDHENTSASTTLESSNNDSSLHDSSHETDFSLPPACPCASPHSSSAMPAPGYASPKSEPQKDPRWSMRYQTHIVCVNKI